MRVRDRIVEKEEKSNIKGTRGQSKGKQKLINRKIWKRGMAKDTIGIRNTVSRSGKTWLYTENKKIIIVIEFRFGGVGGE